MALYGVSLDVQLDGDGQLGSQGMGEKQVELRTSLSVRGVRGSQVWS